MADPNEAAAAMQNLSVEGEGAAAAGEGAAATGAAAAAPAPTPTPAPTPAPAAPPSGAGGDQGYQEPEIPPVTLNGTQYKPLADGKYDAIVLSTGLSECVLAGLLSVRGLKVLQIDRNAYYGGSCASLNLQELYEKHNKPFDKALEGKFGRSRDYCVDTAPKLLMAGGKLIKMLVQTGCTRYMDFGGIAGSYCLNSGKIYRMPVTPTEALTSSLISLFQKNNLRKFAEFIRSYQCPKRVADTLTTAEFKETVSNFYKVHNAAKLQDVENLVNQYNTKRELLVAALEKKYGLPVFPEETEIEFGPGSLGINIDNAPVKKVTADGGPIKTLVTVIAFLPQQDGQKGPAEKSGKVKVGDVICKVNGQTTIGLSVAQVKEMITSAPRPIKITFMKPAFDTSKQKYDLLSMTMRELFSKYGIDDNTGNAIGHVMALETDDSYLDRPAEPTVLKCQLYGRSVGRFGQDSPYLYPKYGLSTLPEGFSRLSAIFGGTVMLRTNVDEILKDSTTGKACGVRVGDQAASAPIIIGDASYFPPEMSRKTGQIVRSICLLKHPIKNTVGDSAQIILPAKHLQAKKKDVYISALGPSLQVCPKGVSLAIASTTVETQQPKAELRQAFELLGQIEEQFDSITDTYGPVDDGSKSGCYIVQSLDATSHFESAALDIMRIYRAINNKGLDLDEKLVDFEQ